MLAFIAKESPRWLLAVGRKEEATRVVEGIAKVNGKEVDKKTGNSWQPLFVSSNFSSGRRRWSPGVFVRR